MALKDLLVHIDQTEQASQRLQLAADLAKRNQSRLTALFVREMTPAQQHALSSAELGLASASAIDEENLRIRNDMDAVESRLASNLQAAARKYGIEVEWRSLQGVASILVPQHARFADLCVVSQDVSPADLNTGYTFSEQLLFVTGRPVVFVPPSGSFESLGKHVLVAWNSSRACARSLADALPIIECAERVTVLAINSEQFAKRYAALPPGNIVENLRRHGAEVDGISLDGVATAAISETLLTQARRVGADLIVAGAFGHPRLWEKMMGGVTRDLLARMDRPVLMSY
ncbi:MAG TPA: universal stress protein [Steroidobacteraceae bacterium]|nr:universal stress protein [Steroidobacteraceae bacterium]